MNFWRFLSTDADVVPEFFNLAEEMAPPEPSAKRRRITTGESVESGKEMDSSASEIETAKKGRKKKNSGKMKSLGFFFR